MKKSHFIFLLVISFLLVLFMFGCKPKETAFNYRIEGWHKINAGDQFSFYAPVAMEKIDVQGIDSFVGEYRNDDYKITFDYGMYSNHLDNLNNNYEYWEKITKIDDRRARLVGYMTIDDSDNLTYYMADVYINDAYPREEFDRHLTMYISYSKPENKENAIRIIESIDFP